ncbi:MAG TPA: HAMP domain-containing sensor histidine kinase, partial [Chloroflexota bacterium]|nr:HAMP domain-containing sensor histidine kinase [Chloroflexota bacterium]
FVSSISHDLKGPLSNAKGYAELLRRRLTSATLLDPEELAKLAARIERNASRAVGMVDELLDVARLRMGSTLNLHRRPTDLVILTQQVVEQLQPTTPRIRFESTVASIVGEWDDVRLERVLVNLVSNALKFSPGDSAIFITVGEEVHPEATFGVVSIRDQGVGIPSADLPHIFDPFHRANNVRGQFQGTGLGLASSRQIVEQHGGTIEVESREGHGSVFTVRLPLHPSGG